MKLRKIPLVVLPFMLLASCGGASNVTPSDVTRLSFKSASSYEYLADLSGEKVEICGFMATSSPVDGSFIFLMNLPYQNCPFCKPNTSQLSNTIEVYPKRGETFSYTTQAIKVSGKLSVAPEGKFFTDPYGYEFSFKIVDAEYSIMKESEMSSDLALWQKLSSSGLVSDLYAMYDYVYFTCMWPTYFVNTHYDVDGNEIKGFYLYPADAEKFLKTEGAQWNYGYQPGYFDNLVNRLEKISKTKFTDVKTNIRKAESLAEYAISELENHNYTYEYQYVSRFDTEDYIFTMNDQTMLKQWETLYIEFTDWIGSFEM